MRQECVSMRQSGCTLMTDEATHPPEEEELLAVGGGTDEEVSR